MNYLNIYFDGGCEPRNPGGHMAWAIAVQELGSDETTGEKWALLTHKQYWYKGAEAGNTNNVAEFNGLIEALRWATANISEWDSLTIYGDSQLAVNIINGVWNANSDKKYYEAYQEARSLYLELIKASFSQEKTLQIKWVPRELNKVADGLCRECYTLHGVKQTDWSALKNKKFKLLL